MGLHKRTDMAFITAIRLSDNNGVGMCRFFGPHEEYDPRMSQTETTLTMLFSASKSEGLRV